MIYQNELDSSISHIACYYDSIAFFREYYQNHVWTIDELNNGFALCKLKGYIDKNLLIKNPTGVANVLGARIRFKDKYYLDYIPDVNDYVVGCWKMTANAEDAHFIVMDNSGSYTKEHIIFDPWQGGSKTAHEGLCTSLRVFSKI